METSHTKGENENEESIRESDARDISKNITTKNRDMEEGDREDNEIEY